LQVPPSGKGQYKTIRTKKVSSPEAPGYPQASKIMGSGGIVSFAYYGLFVFMDVSCKAYNTGNCHEQKLTGSIKT
jgi:hypothetical protein